MAGQVKCLNPWDVQSKHVVTTEGVSESLCAGEKRWGSLPPIICLQKDPNRMNEKVIGCDLYNQVLTGNIACALTASMEVAGRSGPKVIVRHAVCYAVENHPNDSRIKIDDNGIVQTLSSRMGTGGVTHH